MSTSDRTSVLTQIADIEEQLARLQEQQAGAEELLRSLRKQLERDDTVSARTRMQLGSVGTSGLLTPLVS